MPQITNTTTCLTLVEAINTLEDTYLAKCFIGKDQSRGYASWYNKKTTKNKEGSGLSGAFANNI
jgi:TorA maturation chaperone TorD